MDLYTWIIISTLFTLGVTEDIHVRQGESLDITLPTVKACGQYTLLNPALRPVVVVEGQNTTNVIGWYSDRVVVRQTEHGFLLTIQAITKTDEGNYKIASSATRMSAACVHEPYVVTVIGSNGEYLKPWSEWTFCINQCSHLTRRRRSRECNVIGGCRDLGPLSETQTCDKAEHCSHWSDWGQWGACSAKCGKGFKMRKRVCLNGNSSLVRNSQCRGVATHSHMCLTVCEVVGTWTQWSSWSNCSKSCDVTVTEMGTRTRKRTCSTDKGQRLVAENCTGNRTESEACGNTDCLDSKVITTIPVIQESRDHSYTITVVSMVAGIVCIKIVFIILVCVLVLRRRRPRRGSAPTLRPADSASNRRFKKKSTDRRSAPSPEQVDSGNVYSDLSSGAGWPSTEFDSSYDINSKAFSQHCGGDAEADINDPDADCDASDFDSDFDDVTDQPVRDTQCDRTEIIYETSRKSYVRTISGDRNKNTTNADKLSTISSEVYEVITENQCYEPPQLWSSNDIMNSFDSDDVIPTGSTENIVKSGQQEDGQESVYYEPPDESKEKAHIAEMKRKESEMSNESIYENFGFERDLADSDDINENSYEVPANCLCDKDKNISENSVTDTKVNKAATDETDADKDGVSVVRMRNGSVVKVDEKTNSIKSEPIYANEKFVRDSGKFYSTPKYTYGLSIKEKKVDDNHIYDIPKFTK